MPTFSPRDDGSGHDVGIANHGDEAALFFQLRVVHSETGRTLLDLAPRDPPVHLSVSQFVGLVHDTPPQKSDILSVIQDEEISDSDEIHFYYTYNTVSSGRFPKDLDVDISVEDMCILDQIQRNRGAPRRIDVRRIRELCDT
jgi:hypothetical protein